MKTIHIYTSFFFTLLIFSANKIFAGCRSTPVDSGTVKLTVLFPEAAKGQKLELYVAKSGTSINVLSDEYSRYVQLPVSPGKYIFVFKVSNRGPLPGANICLFALNPSNIFIKDQDGMSKDDIFFDLLQDYFVQPSDVITISYKKTPQYQQGRTFRHNFNINFSGLSSAKYKARYFIDSIQYHRDFPLDYFLADSTYNTNNGELADAKKELDYLSSIKSKLDTQAYEELRIHALYYNKWFEATLLQSFFYNHYKNASDKVRQKFLRQYETFDIANRANFDHDILKHCYDFWTSELNKYETMIRVRDKKWIVDSTASFYADIKDEDEREKLFLLTIKSNMGRFANFNSYLTKASKYVISDEGKATLSNSFAAGEGSPAFNFNLTDTKGKKVKLSAFKGKVVFIDFWYTGCENCVNYYHDVLSKVEHKFKSDSNYVFISISIDKNDQFWKHSIDRGIYTSPSGINLYTNGEGLFNDVIKFYRVVGYPQPMIIDKEQRIFKVGKSLRDETLLNQSLISAAAK